MVLDEMRAIAAYIRGLFPGCVTALSVPTTPVSGLWIVRHERVNTSQMSGAVMDNKRDYTVITHHESEETAIAFMDTLHKRVMRGAKVDGGGVTVRLTGFGYASPVRLDGGLYALVGTLTTQTLTPTGTAEDYPTEPLMAGVTTNFLGVD